ncbi:Alpha/Beta hydrolase protein [Cyathus striatus]|nr:Alpha/Beta hydrolase protein [Cyathus striatus]
MSTTGTVEFKFKGKVYQTWYKVFGDLKGSGKTPLIALHGGPGMTHHYMLPHAILNEKAGIPVVVYDEIGNGQSSHASEEPKEFWNPEVFMDELHNLVNELGISSDFGLLGHSWGGMLAANYACERAPAGLKRIIVVNSPADMVSFEKGTNELLQKFPPEFVKRVRELEQTGKGHSEEYKQCMFQFYNKHVCTVVPPPKNLLESIMAMEANKNVRIAMMGVSELCPNGNLKDMGWSLINELHKVKASLLLISSPHDEMQEEAVIPYFLNTPKAKWVEIPTTTHSPFYEDPDKYFSVILSFLKSTN